MAPVNEAVSRKKIEAGEEPWLKKEISRTLGILLGVLVYAVGVNIFLRPLRLYSGGFMGFAQLCTTILQEYLHFKPGNLDLAGIIYYLMNLPFLIMVYRVLKGKYVLKTVITVSLMTLVLTLIPIPAAPVLDEKLANCLVAGILVGTGIGLVLRMGASDGGMDLVGILLIRKKGDLSIGTINTAANVVLYAICLFLFDVPTVIYSLICSVISALLCDRVYTQNINVQALIVTKTEDLGSLEVELMGRMGRGITRWNASGAYTGQEEKVLMVILNKYEVSRLKTIVQEFDPNAFIIIDEGVSVYGHFLKKLT